MPRDLEGVLVVALEQAVAAPYATCRLADAGARVVKLERPGGDFARHYDSYAQGLSSYFVWLNRGKQSMRFDLKDQGDLALFDQLIRKADVFIQNLSPGATERAGIGSAQLRARNPRLITCDVSGYGRTGPASHLKAYDLLVQAESGVAYLSGTEAEPGRVGVPVCDIATGMYAHQAILQALYAREKSGRGRGIEVSLFHAMADWMNVPYMQRRYGGIVPSRGGLKHPTLAPYGAFGCKDGKLILISIQNEREWQSLCTGVLDRPDMLTDPLFATNAARIDNRPELDRQVDAIFGTMTGEEAVNRLEASRIAYGRLSTLDDFVAHSQNRFIDVPTPNGTLEMLAPPAAVLDDEPEFGAVPDYGEHDHAIRQELMREMAASPLSSMSGRLS